MNHEQKDWVSGSILPAQPGTYEVGHDPKTAPHRRNKMYLTGHRRYFDGVTWRAGWSNEQVSIFGQHPSHQWREIPKQENR